MRPARLAPPAGTTALLAALPGVACLFVPESPDEVEVPPLDAPWPAGFTAAIPCTPYPGGFAEPVLTGSGAIRIETSAALVPAGVAERLRITVLTAGGNRDTSAAGPLGLSVDTGEVLAASAVSEGRAEATVRFSGAGRATVRASFAGGRAGTQEVMVYPPQLPIWELQLDPDQLAVIVASPDDYLWIPVVVSAEGTTLPAQMRLHGGSSRYYDKNSFRLKLDDDGRIAGAKNHILRGEYADKTLLRNWINYQLFRAGTWLPTPRTELVHLRINGAYYGLMNHVERIDAHFLHRNGLSSAGSMYEPDPDLAHTVPGGNLTPLDDVEEYPIVYQQHHGDRAYEDLIELIELYLQLPEPEFSTFIPGEVAVAHHLVYAAMMSLIQNHDHVRKNYYIFRDHDDPADPGWQFFPWDLDLSLGHLWTEENDILDERIFTDGDIFMGDKVPERYGYYNQLTYRLLGRAGYRATYLDYLQRILDHTFTEEHIDALIDDALCRATPDIIGDRRKRADNGEYLARIEELRGFVTTRRAFVQAAIDQSR
jgi:spore coat protein CotH